MQDRLNHTVMNLETSGIRQFNEMANKVEGCIRFTLGEPNFDSDSAIKKAVKRALDHDLTHYSSNAGNIELRNKISNDLYLRYGIKYSEDEIVITQGASEAISVALRSIIDVGDEIIVFEPAYPAYRPLIEMFDGVYVGIDTCDDAFQINEAKLQAALSEKTKGIILTSPNNPTGVAYNQESLDAVERAIENRDIFVISDNIYDQIVYEEIPCFMTKQKHRSKLIGIQSFSKTYAMAGYRVGYLCADKFIAQQMLRAHAFIVSSISTFVQEGAIAAFSTSTDKMLKQYLKNRDYALNRLHEMGLAIEAPQGAFYLFVNISQFNMKSYEFAYKLLHDAKVAVVPGQFFGGPHCDDYIRLSYACSYRDLREGLRRMDKFITHYYNSL